MADHYNRKWDLTLEVTSLILLAYIDGKGSYRL